MTADFEIARSEYVVRSHLVPLLVGTVAINGLAPSFIGNLVLLCPVIIPSTSCSLRGLGRYRGHVQPDTNQHDLTDRLLTAIRATTGLPDLAWAVSPTSLPGGFWATMFVVELSGAPPALSGRKVARVMPDAITAAREIAVQRWAFAAGVPVPEVRASGQPNACFDHAWSLMDFAPGQPLLAGLSAVSALRNARTIAHRMPDLLAQAAARLHHCDASSLEAEQGETGRLTIVAFLQRLAATADLAGRVDLADHAHRLEAAAPSGSALCHGDLHPFNVLVDSPVDGDNWTIIDWSTAAIADPHYDLAFTTLMLSNPPLGGPRPIKAAVRAIGNRLANRFLRRYEHHAGVAVDPMRLDWGRRVHALRALIEVAEWEAAGTISAHRGHPWLQLRPVLERLLAPQRR
jgi:aminoglycoside phosphotransferase (APT) family kinase protein